MEFRQIDYFLAACDTLNITRASELCNVSQPALTVAIHKLEQDLGGTLFHRTATGLTLTPLGRTMRTHLGRLNETREIARQAAQDLVAGEMEMVDLGVMCTVSAHYLGPALAQWQDSCENTELIIHDVWGAKAQELLISEALDAAIIAVTQPLPQRFHTIPLFSEPMVAAMTADHPLAAKESLCLNDLNGVKYVDRLRCEFRSSFLTALSAQDLQIDVVIKSEREDWILKALQDGVGISIMPHSFAQSGGLQSRQIVDLAVERSIEFVSTQKTHSRPALNGLSEFLAGYDFNIS